MIVDCFTHTWESDSCLGRGVPANGRAPAGSDHREPHHADAGRHLAATAPVNTTIVFGFKSRYLGAEIPNNQVAEYVRSHADRLIGFAGVDPSEPKEALAELQRARQELSMPGLSVAPAAQDFHPSSSQAMRVYAEAARLRMPIVFHTGVHVSRATKMEYAQPVLLDEVARELPELRIVIAHMGYPWVHETITLLLKHPNVFAEVSWLVQQPWQAYQAFLSAHQCGVMDKLLFGSGFPVAPASMCIESLYSLNHLVHGTNFPTIPREQLRGIVERDALALLGISTDRRPFTPANPAVEPIDEVHDEM